MAGLENLAASQGKSINLFGREILAHVLRRVAQFLGDERIRIAHVGAERFKRPLDRIAHVARDEGPEVVLLAGGR